MSAIRPIRWTGAQRSSYLLLVAPGLLVAIDSSVLLLAIPSLNTALKPTAAESIWINDIYGFMVAAFMIPAGRLADRVGRKRLLLVACGLFAGASVAAAFSISATMLIVARGTIGIAASAIIPCCIAVIRDVFADERQRSVAMGMWTAFFAVGVAVGPLIGGLLLSELLVGFRLPHRRPRRCAGHPPRPEVHSR
ncbi:MFS transporter [Leifsonia sp. TF02-11]|uniref:MFS transporter n=1 Tax=Leifsonia sp. TF02-11 TaxID=2815212 RepID=UPI001AA14FD3|nr:MFS transporter [Leifsonia sp. TF02-11]MBO1741429.1 MFS transporter [Leifsonia sp. TF02-11]